MQPGDYVFGSIVLPIPKYCYKKSKRSKGKNKGKSSKRDSSDEVELLTPVTANENPQRSNQFGVIGNFGPVFNGFDQSGAQGDFFGSIKTTLLPDGTFRFLEKNLVTLVCLEEA